MEDAGNRQPIPPSMIFCVIWGIGGIRFRGFRFIGGIIFRGIRFRGDQI